MQNRIITRLFDTREHALAAVRDLEAAGFSHENLGIVASNGAGEAVTDTSVRHDTTHHKSGTGIGATLGTLVGGGAGLAAGLGAIAIPGIGPLVAAGALVAALTGAGAGAVAGGLVGSLTGMGVNEADAPVYAEGMRRGGSLVTVRTTEDRAAEAERILNQHGPVDIRNREADYRASGWNGYEEDDGLVERDPALRRTGAAPGALNDPLMPGGISNPRV